MFFTPNDEENFWYNNIIPIVLVEYSSFFVNLRDNTKVIAKTI